MSEFLDIFSMGLYYAIIVIGVMGVVAIILYSFYWIAGKVIKLLGYWPMFWKALMRIGMEEHEKRKRKARERPRKTR